MEKSNFLIKLIKFQNKKTDYNLRANLSGLKGRKIEKSWKINSINHFSFLGKIFYSKEYNLLQKLCSLNYVFILYLEEDGSQRGFGWHFEMIFAVFFILLI